MTTRKEEVETSFKLENSYASLSEKFFSKQYPDNVASPKIAAINYSLIENLGLDVNELKGSKGIEIFSGNKIPKGSIPIAEAYAGHQFGHFTMLGDGRAVLLGELKTSNGGKYDIQLKGSGITPYSRGGDGKAALGPMLREYIISEAMHALNISTTRSLAVVTTGEEILRETYLPGAVLTRLAKSHIRVGTFQYIRNFGTVAELKELADYTIDRHFKRDNIGGNPYIYLLNEVIKLQAELIAKWMLVGFVHGVMNTDNVSICGETIDYGPCAFMDIYDPETVFSSIDTEGRYAYANQPGIAAWNMARFAESLLPLLSDDEEEAIKIAEKSINEFLKEFRKHYLSGMRAKLGLFNEEEEDQELIEGILSLMHKYKADYTNTFIDLTFDEMSSKEIYNSDDFQKWYKLWKDRLGRQENSKEEVIKLMKNSNPAVIPRNHRVEEALEAAVKFGNYSVMDNLLNVLSKPYAHSIDQESYKRLPKESSCKYTTYCGT